MERFGTLRIYEVSINHVEDRRFECTICMTRDYESIGSDGQPVVAAVHGD